VIDATGRLVFPGFIDPHAHIYLPFMVTFAKDTHETGSIAALGGCTTTYIEMCSPSRLDDALEGVEPVKRVPTAQSEHRGRRFGCGRGGCVANQASVRDSTCRDLEFSALARNDPLCSAQHKWVKSGERRG
jgi:hypothetical protein